MNVVRDFPHVFRHGVGVLHEIANGAGVNGKVLPAQTLGHMTQWQEQHAFVVFILTQHLVVAPHDVSQCCVAVHGAFGFAGGPRGVNQDGQVFRTAAGHSLFKHAGLLGVVGFTHLPQAV